MLLYERYNFAYGLYLKALCQEHGCIPTTMQESVLSHVLFKGLYYGISIPSSIYTVTRTWSDNYVKEMNIVLTNLVSCVKKGKYLKYSRDSTSVKKNRYNKKGIKNSRILKAIDRLEEKGYCLNLIASSKQNPKEPMMPSFLQPTQKFIDEFCDADEVIKLTEQAYLCGQETIILRDEKGKDIDYRDDAQTRSMRNLVIKLNTISDQCVFKRRGGSVMDNFVVRIFSLGDFSLGGRFARSDLQVMPNKADERLFITIDDLQVVEIDYSNLHIRLLTDLHNVDYSKYKDGDLYIMPLSDEQITADNRWLIKQAVNIMFNSTSERGAMTTIQDKMRKAQGRTFSFSGPKEVVTAIKAAYPWLADDFCQPVPRGHYLMNLDSNIAADVAQVFADEGLPIGIIHDSFIVQEPYRDKLAHAMVAAYRKHTKRPTAQVHMKLKYVQHLPLDSGSEIIEELIVAAFPK